MPRLEYLVGSRYHMAHGSVHTCNNCWPPTKAWLDDFLSDYWQQERLCFESPPTGYEAEYVCLVCNKPLTPADLRDVKEPTLLELA